ncbi:uncharacterized protein LOC118479413 [Helianthus annuus]|uniref:uncharacterized protein LOC118479413 n=1 Tax=Helianthus annuus TaxID=4232 RepID=UPI00165307C8|nr:uncharacterized protein LOC118479413 [Helianthus annuus]
MSGGASDNVLSLTTDELKEKIAEEVGRAIEVSLPRFVERMQNTLLSTMEERIGELREDLTSDRGKAKEKKGCSYNKFMACKPPVFNGEVDPIACQRWISDIEGVFERTHCDESDFVAYGTGQLRGQAKDWWDNLRNERGVETIRAMTWEAFKVPFLKHHSPKAVINKIKEEFMQLRQKGETVDKITGMFMDKLKFCDDLVKTEEQKIYYYHTMLRAEYREFMTPSHYESLTDIINAAREREIELKRQVERGERRALDENPSPTKKLKVAESSKKGSAKGGSPSCKTCGRTHKGECYFKNKPCVACGKIGHGVANCPHKVTVCYKCYQPGHKKSECPELVGKKESTDSRDETPKAKARSFQITAAEAKMEPDVVTVVVGMDWLSRYNAKVICLRKEIHLTSPSGRRVIIYGEKACNPMICSMIEARKFILHGCKAYLTYIRAVEKETPRIEDVPVVREFKDVFPEDLPGMPPEREIEFGIELTPGAKPVAKAPYRLAPSELQELMSQLQDLLEKGFIRPSVSPWGAPTTSSFIQETRRSTLTIYEKYWRY